MNHPPKVKHPRSSLRIFLRHFAWNLIIGGIVTLMILFIGMMGYRYYEKTDWLDSYANASMIISGVGTLTNPVTSAGKLFVATYSIFGGGIYLLVVGVIFAPIFHWISRRMRLEDREHF